LLYQNWCQDTSDQDTSDPRHFGTIKLVYKCRDSSTVDTSAKVSQGHFGTGNEQSSTSSNHALQNEGLILLVNITKEDH